MSYEVGDRVVFHVPTWDSGGSNLLAGRHRGQIMKRLDPDHQGRYYHVRPDLAHDLLMTLAEDQVYPLSAVERLADLVS